MNLVSFLAVGFGAFAGAIVRWLFGLALNPILPSLPLGTLAANLVGALAMGIAIGAFAHFDRAAFHLEHECAAFRHRDHEVDGARRSADQRFPQCCRLRRIIRVRLW